MPNIATTWEIEEKIFETLPWEQPWVTLLKCTGTQTTSHAIHKTDEVGKKSCV